MTDRNPSDSAFRRGSLLRGARLARRYGVAHRSVQVALAVLRHERRPGSTPASAAAYELALVKRYLPYGGAREAA